jgi:lysyl-tRNA synthetase class 2
MLRLAFVRTLQHHFAHPSHHHPIRIFSQMAAESAGTHKDPVTGEMISKQSVLIILTNRRPFSHQSMLHRELKRRQKQREKEAKRAGNAASQPPAQSNPADDFTNEEDLSPNVRSVQVISALRSIDGQWADAFLKFPFAHHTQH